MKMLLNWIVALLCFVGSFTARGATSDQPNIIFILADDLGYADVGFAGGKEIKTPNIDKLAAEGTILTQFYVQPVCTPTRASLMTGRYPIRYGLQKGVIVPWAQYGLSLNEQLLPQGLKDAGYSTSIVGKWHLGHFDRAYWPMARGFEHHYGHYFGAIDYYTHTRDGIPDWYRDGNPLKEEGYSTHLICAEAVSVIKAQPKDKPLFLYAAFNAVHTPLESPKNYIAPYKQLKEPRRTYAGMLAVLDESVGKIVNAIEETGRRKNTLFIFSSDNGGPNPHKMTDNGIYRGGKGTFYEGGVRACAFVTWDGHVAAGKKVDAMMHMIDWYPTLLKLSGASVKQKLALDGRDIWPTITENKPSPHSELLVNIQPNGGAIHVGDWKLVLNSPQSKSEVVNEDSPSAEQVKQRKGSRGEAVELFNLSDDPREKHNLAASNPEKVKELRAHLAVYEKEAVTPLNLIPPKRPANASKLE